MSAKWMRYVTIHARSCEISPEHQHDCTCSFRLVTVDELVRQLAYGIDRLYQRDTEDDREQRRTGTAPEPPFPYQAKWRNEMVTVTGLAGDLRNVRSGDGHTFSVHRYALRPRGWRDLA